jgi:hypothetical protein
MGTGAAAIDSSADAGYPPSVTSPLAPQLELRWDGGTLANAHLWPEPGIWVGNDFDVSTLCARRVQTIRVFSTAAWPNGSWDGFRVALYAFTGGVPGSLIWPPGGGQYYRPAGMGWRWCDVPVEWTLPSSRNAFVAAMDQYYPYPNCDPYAVDGEPLRGDSWQYGQGQWTKLETEGNLMLRVIVQGEIGVAPATLSRVKALYR